jgi:hypothetical protein
MAQTTYQFTTSGSEQLRIGDGFNVDTTTWAIQVEASSSWTGSILPLKTVYGASAPFTTSYTRMDTGLPAIGAISSSGVGARLNQGILVDGSGCTVLLQHTNTNGANTGSVTITASMIRATGRAG